MNKRLVCVLIILPLLGVLAGCRDKRSEASAPALKVRITVETASVQRRTLSSGRSFPGVLEPQEKVDLAPAMPGRIKRLPVRIGEHVKKGASLALLDDATLVSTIARFQPLKQQYDRSVKLYETQAISKSQFETIEAEYIALKRQIEHLQENTTLAAPFSGVITDLTAQEGELYTPGVPRGPGRSTGLVQIVKTDPLRVDLSVDDRTVSYLRKGMEVVLTCDVLPDTLLSGRVEWVNPSASAASRTFPVRILVPNAGGKLRPGYFVQARIVIEKKDNVLSVPRSALLGDRVFVVRDSIAVARSVSVGWATDEYVEIVSGLEEGTIVVTKGNRALPDSTIVRVQTEGTLK